MTPSPLSRLALCAAIAPLAVQAQTAGPASPIMLDTVVISGGLSPVAADAYGRAFTVLTADDIERRGLRTVQDALRTVPGVSVSSTGSSITQVRIRGAEANHTLVLIDGVQAAGGADEYVMSSLETANIERIEVLRGPQSVFFGSNASAGVINIITRRGRSGTHYGGAAEVGNGTAASGWFTQRGPRGGLAFTASARDDKGFDQSGDGGEKDGSDRQTIGLTGDWKPADDVTLGFTLRRAGEDYDYDAVNLGATDADSYLIDDPTLYGERTEVSGAAWAEYAMLDGRLTHRLEVQGTVLKLSDNGGDETRGETRALKYRLSYGLDGQPVESAAHLLNVMVERIDDENNAGPDFDRRNTSVALEYRGFLDNGLDVQAGLRRDDNEVFQDFTSWNLGLSWRIPDTALRLHASAGRGLVNPAFYELYADDAFTVGNPDLRPERNTGFDIGIEAGLLDGRGLIDVTYFNETMDDEITYVFGAAPDGVRATYVNEVGESPREGVEVAARLQATDALDLGLTYTYLSAKGPDGSVEIRRPRHELGLTASLAVAGGRGRITADLRHVAGNYDTQFWGAFATEELPDFTVVNLTGGYDVTDSLRLTSRVVNLFDEEYSDVWGYASAGRTVHVGLETAW